MWWRGWCVVRVCSKWLGFVWLVVCCSAQWIVAVLLAGAITKTIISPLERIKILFQLQGMGLVGSPQKPKYTGIMQAARLCVAEEGFLSLWRGNGANVLRVVPVYALKFGFNDSFRVLVAGEEAVKQRSLSFVQMMSSGTLAGLFQQMITYPLEVVRTRLSLGPGMGMEYKGIVHCAVSVVKSEGISGMYKGVMPTLLSGAPFVGIQMTTFDMMKRAFEPIDPMPTHDGHVSLPLKLLAGASAGLIAQTITYPGDTIRRRMQTNGANGVARTYSTSWDCTKQIVRKEGIRGFYAGVSTNIVRSVPGAAIQFVAYEQLKKLFDARL